MGDHSSGPPFLTYPASIIGFNYFMYRWVGACPPPGAANRLRRQVPESGSGLPLNPRPGIQCNRYYFLVSSGSNYEDQLTFNLDHLKGAGQTRGRPIIARPFERVEQMSFAFHFHKHSPARKNPAGKTSKREITTVVNCFLPVTNFALRFLLPHQTA